MTIAPTKLDAFIERVWPKIGLQRAIARHELQVLAQTIGANTIGAGGYRGGQYGRLRAAPARATQAEDKAAGWTYGNMVANAMQLYRDSPFTRAIVTASCDALGASKPTPTTTDPAWNAIAGQYFNEYWWPQADARRRPGVDFGELQGIWERWAWLGGDMIFGLRDGQLLPYEGLQIQTPQGLYADRNILNGVRMQGKSPWRITHYYLTGVDAKGKAVHERVKAWDVIYAGSRNWRANMLRAVPDLHGVIDALDTYNKTHDHVAKRIEFEAMLFTVERKGAVNAGPGSKFFASGGGTDVEMTPADWGMRMKVNGDPEKDFRPFQMQNPQASYPAIMEHMGRLICAGVRLPYECVMHLYTNGSYTAQRAAWNAFAKAILARWAWRNKVLNQRVYNWRIAKAIKDEEIPPAPVDERTGLSQWHRCAWSLPHFSHIDEGKEVLADINQWGCGQESMEDWAQQRGMNRGQMLDAHDLDIAECKRRAEALEIPLEMYMGKLFSASAAKDRIPEPTNTEDK